MSAPVPPGATRPNNSQSQPPPPNYVPNMNRTPDSSLSQNFQNMHINQTPSAPPPSSAGSVRPPPFGQAPRFPPSAAGPPASFLGPSPASRPGPPPPGVVPRAAAAPAGPMASPSMIPGRPSIPPPGVQPQPFASRPPSQGPFSAGGPAVPPPGAPTAIPARSQPVAPPLMSHPSGFGSPPMTTGQVALPTAPPSAVSNGHPMFQTGNLSGGPRFSSPGGPRQPPVGPPPMSASSVRAPFQAPPVRSFPGTGPAGSSTDHASPLSQSSSPFAGPPQVQGAPPPLGSPYGMQPPQLRKVTPPPSMSGSMQPPRMYGMPPSGPSQTMANMPAMSQTGPSKIDPNQIPRPLPNSSMVVHETRVGNQANLPPPATSEYIVKDTGNCSPRYMRCTINQIPCTADLLGTSGMQLALLVQPFALPHPSEEPIQVVDFGEGGPVRCSRCKAYINPFVKFIDQGRKFICNLCGVTDETPRDYHCNLGPDGRRRDADDRPELCRGTVEFIATKEYMVREPMPAVFFFLIDVSMNALQTGATAATCSAINQVIADLPEGPRTMVGIATFDSTIHFYNLKRASQQPLMLIVPDVQDVYTPLESDVIVRLSECRQHIELLLESIPTMFQSNMTADSALGAAIKAAFLAMKSTGGKLLVFQSVLPSVGIGALSAREAEGRTNTSAGEKEAHRLLQPADKTLKEMAIEFAEFQVCVDFFITTQSYVDIASTSVIPKTTGGQVYYYYPFSAVSDTAKLYNDLRWNVTRPQGFEAVMRVRCSQGLQVQEYSGNFCKRIPTDVDLPAIDCDKALMVSLKHDDKLQDGAECSFQCALLYTTVYGQRRIRVSTLSLTCTSVLSNLFRSADLDTQFACFMKQAAIGVPTTPLLQVREQVTNHCVNILHSYRKFCANLSVSSAGQLILPEALKLLPLYTLALIKSIGLRTDGRTDVRSFWTTYVSSLSTTLAVPLVYPRMFSVHDLETKEMDGSAIPPVIPLSSEHVSDEGIYLLENGEDALVYVGTSVDPSIIQSLFGTTSVDEVPTQFVLQQYDNLLSKKFNEVINEIRRQRCSYLRFKLCKKGDALGMLFFSYMVEDKTPTGLSYVEFLVHIHRQIQGKMA
ncbi:protein transport protein Sec24-like At4g32640 [Chenopodium quinoa]|uniref:protein transport protein Sec24-like At4g32640 n=1 Tax=Chenopodium quinoa TaxID=63459 RepID=UPI000B77EB36|nr:protein transport protein Sec24-like At4g32640 [Chenopodium quinoa]